jgi:hypothetical protein
MASLPPIPLPPKKSKKKAVLMVLFLIVVVVVIAFLWSIVKFVGQYGV